MKVIEDLNNVDEDPLTPGDLKSLLHRRGICIRHLGILCTEAKLNHTREAIVIEVASRCIKRLIRKAISDIFQSFLDRNDDEEFELPFSQISAKIAILL